MEQVRGAMGMGHGGEHGGHLPHLATEEQGRQGGQGGWGQGQGREQGRGGQGGYGGQGQGREQKRGTHTWFGRGGRERGGALPRLVGQEEGWERKEGGECGGWGRGGGGYEEEEEMGVPAGNRYREKYPESTDYWSDWNFGLTYNEDEWGDPLFWRAVLAEGAATTAFTYFLISTWISLQGGGLTDIGILRVALTAGFAYGVLNWLFHNISGGHMNPAVTLATCLNGRITFVRALCYWGAQIVGGIAGAGMARAMNPSSFRVLHGAVNRLNVGWRAGFLGEIMGTLLVVFAFLVAYDRRRRLGSDHINVLAPLIIGLAVTAAHLFLIPYTWCSINPARSFGSAVIGARWSSHWIWWVGPIVAGIAGPLIYETFFKHFYAPAQIHWSEGEQKRFQMEQAGRGEQQQQHQQTGEGRGIGMSTFK